MQSADIIAIIALLVSIIAIPIGYLLGSRNARHNAHNEAIDTLQELCNRIFEDALRIHKNNSSSDETDFHLMIAYHRRLQAKCAEIKELAQNDFYPRLEVREVKQVTTDYLFSDNQEIRNVAIRSLIYKLDAVYSQYHKKFI